MKRASAIVLGLAVVLGIPWAAAAGLPAGNCLASGDSLTCTFGLEVWEEGKRSERIFQQWELFCSRPSSQDRPSCKLERTQILILDSQGSIATHNHSTADKTLVVLEADWQDSGRLRFDVIYPDGARMPVMIGLEKAETRILRLFSIASFQAKQVIRTLVSGEIVWQELRTPEYSYAMAVPMPMLGQKSEDDRRRDEMVKRLSPSDRLVFLKIQRSTEGPFSKCFKPEMWLENEPLRTAFQPYSRKLEEIDREITAAKKGDPRRMLDLFAQQQAINNELDAVWRRDDVQRFLRAKVAECFTKAGMSQVGSEVAAENFVDGMASTPPPTTATPQCTPSGSTTVATAVLAISGTYTGIISGTQSGREFTMPVTFTVAQNGNEVTGTWATGVGTSGKTRGVLAGSEVSNFRLSQVAPCPGSFSGSLSIEERGARLRGAYAGMACGEQVTASFVVTRLP
jgi:hypothetical protein